MPSRFLFRCPDTCETCRFWQPDEDFDDGVLGECRLRAPRVSPASDGRSDVETVSVVLRRPGPMTESRDWCLEWRRGAA